jgi:hypothetical protein
MCVLWNQKIQHYFMYEGVTKFSICSTFYLCFMIQQALKMAIMTRVSVKRKLVFKKKKLKKKKTIVKHNFVWRQFCGRRMVHILFVWRRKWTFFFVSCFTDCSTFAALHALWCMILLYCFAWSLRCMYSLLIYLFYRFYSFICILYNPPVSPSLLSWAHSHLLMHFIFRFIAHFNSIFFFFFKCNHSGNRYLLLCFAFERFFFLTSIDVN